MITHSSILAWKVPSTEETAGPQSKGGKESDTSERLTQHRGRRRSYKDSKKAIFPLRAKTVPKNVHILGWGPHHLVISGSSI